MSRITKIGIPAGGTTSQVLVKNSNTDYDVTWGTGGGGGITGSGTSGYVTFWNGSSTVTGEANLFWDAANDRLGIGTSSPSTTLEVLRGSAGTMAKNAYESGSFEYNGDHKWGIYSSSNTFTSTGVSLMLGFTNATSNSLYPGTEIQFIPNSTLANNHLRVNYTGRAANGTVSSASIDIIRLYQDGRVIMNSSGFNSYTPSSKLIIGSDTDAGYRLDVNGTARIQDNLTISDTKNVILGTTTGTKIGTSTSQKIGFFNATPVVQPSAVTSAQGIADALTSLGLLASSTISGAGGYSISTKTTTYTETATSGEVILLGDTTSAGFTITLPTAVGNTAKITIKKIAGANNLTIDGNGSETIDGGITAVLVRIYESITLVSDNSNWHII